MQNDVEYRDLGVATSGATLFRLIGGSLGTAILGAIFSARLNANLSRLFRPGFAGPAAHNMSVQALLKLPPAVRMRTPRRSPPRSARCFLSLTLVCGIGFVLIWLLPERPLRADGRCLSAMPETNPPVRLPGQPTRICRGADRRGLFVARRPGRAASAHSESWSAPANSIAARGVAARTDRA